MEKLINYVAATILVTSFHCKASAEDLPSPESLFERHVQVSYGENGLEKYPTMTLTTNMLMKEYGVSVPSIAKHKSPGYRFSEGEAMGIRSAGGCNLTFCWEEGMRGFEVINGNELKRWLEQADYHRWENMDKYAKSMETVELTDRDGEITYKVKVVDNFDQENFYFFSKERGHLLATDLMVADLDSFNFRSTDYSDFKQFGPFTLPATATEIQPQITRITTIESVTFEEIPDSVFEIPDAVKLLISKQ
jgi:hypothetical protein